MESSTQLIYNIAMTYCEKYAPDEIAILEINQNNIASMLQTQRETHDNAMGSGLVGLLTVENVLLLLGFITTQILTPVTVEALKLKVKEWMKKSDQTELERATGVSKEIIIVILPKLAEVLEDQERADQK